MTIHQMSILAWLGGGALGATLSKNHRVVGFVVSAIVVGAVADVAIERRYYPPGSSAAAQHELEAELWLESMRSRSARRA